MSRASFPLLLWLLLASAAAPPPATLPDAIEAGRVAATLSDWQTIAFFLMVLLAIATVERIISAWQNRGTASQLADAIDRLADAMKSDASTIAVNMALNGEKLNSVLTALERLPERRK
jgi:hypothetical protein